MAVNLSPVGGVAAQFFDNSGQVLTGGKLYTYLAGTTTPAVTYTTNSGIVANSNPIVLNAAGRVADSGEIWLTDSISYKFVLKDTNDVQIAVWDNVVGINSNFVNYTLQEQTFTATQGQTVFTLTGGIQYTPATNNLSVFVNGSKQVAGVNYLETSTTVFTFVTGLNVGDVVDAITAIPVATNVISSVNVSYNQGGTGAVTTNVQAKLRETVSVKDFGASTSNTASQNNTAFLNAFNNGSPCYVPPGNYLLSTQIGSGIFWTNGIVQVNGVDVTRTFNNFQLPEWNYTSNGSGGNTNVQNFLSVSKIDTYSQPQVGNHYGGGAGGSTTTTSYGNVGFGAYVLPSLTTGYYNTAMGVMSQAYATSSFANTSMGNFALANNVSGNSNVAIGWESLLGCTSSNNTAIGAGSGASVVGGTNNTMVGHEAGLNLIGGYNNVLLGGLAGHELTNSYSNIAIGVSAMQFCGHNGVTTANSNVVIGNTAMQQSSLSDSLRYGSGNVVIGNNAGPNWNDPSSVLIGQNVCQYTNGTGGVYDTVAIGQSALSNSSGIKNVGVGSSVLYNTSTGANNTAIGWQAGVNNTTGSNNVFLGLSASAPNPTTSNAVVLGNYSVTALYCAVTSITSLSDERDKTDVATLSQGLNFINELKPVSFIWNTRDGAKVGIKSAGFLAQDLLETQQSFNADALDLVDTSNEEKLGARYTNLIPVLVKAIQELKAEFDSYKETHP